VFLTRPISAVLVALAVAALIVAVLPTIRKRREVVFEEQE
jgi:TctA family transporter